MSSQGCISDIPSEVLTEILSRLPITTLLDCRCVSKTWLNQLSNPEFVKLHLSRSPPTLIINCFESNNPHQLFKLLPLIDIPYPQDFHYVPAIISDHSSLGSITNNKVLVGSSNGLLLLSNLNDDDLYICNPITREYITLPVILNVGSDKIVAHGFGYDSRNDEYKVVRINQKQSFDNYVTNFVVHTLKSGSCRQIHMKYYFDGNGIQLNGRLLWLIYDPLQDDHWVYSFDLYDESNLLITVPPHTDIKSSTLGVLDGKLCICNNVTNTDLEVWVMGENEFWSTRCEMNSPDDLWLSNKRVKALTVLEDGSILFEWNNHSLFSYHPETTAFEIYDFCEPGFQARVDVRSFVSPKNFDLEDL